MEGTSKGKQPWRRPRLPLSRGRKKKNMNNSRSFTSQTLRYLMRNKLAVIGGLLVMLVFVLSIFAPVRRTIQSINH